MSLQWRYPGVDSQHPGDNEDYFFLDISQHPWVQDQPQDFHEGYTMTSDPILSVKVDSEIPWGNLDAVLM